MQLHRPSWPGLEPAVTDAAVVTERNLRHFIRQPQLLIFSTVQPIMFVLFAYVFGGAVEGHAADRGGVHRLPAARHFRAVGGFPRGRVAVGLSEDLERGVIDRFRSMPMARSAVLIGHHGRPGSQRPDHRPDDRRRLSDRLSVPRRPAQRARLRRGRGRVRLALSWIFAFVALTVRGAEAAQSAGFVVIFPLVFASSVFVPVSSMPDWLQAFAEVSPVTLTTDTARTYALEGGVPGSLPRRPPGSSGHSRSSSHCACGDTGG